MPKGVGVQVPSWAQAMSNLREQLGPLRKAVLVFAVESGQLDNLMSAVFDNMGQAEITVPDGLPEEFRMMIASFLVTQLLITENDGRLVSAG